MYYLIYVGEMYFGHMYDKPGIQSCDLKLDHNNPVSARCDPIVALQGVIMSITITTIAACETAIGLALCVTYFHLRSATDVEALNLLK
jgi:hypothetical protein